MPELLLDIVLILSVALVVTLIFARLRIPVFVGLFAVGVLVGPSGLSLLSDAARVHELAEIGVVLLLFTVGMEFSVPELLRVRSSLLVGGSVQLLLSGAIGWAFATILELDLAQAIVVAMAVSLSSTAIVLRLLQERGETDSPHGLNSLGILIFQDLAVVIFIVLLPLLSGTSPPGRSLWFLAIEALALLGGIFLAAKWVVPWIFALIVRARSSELFLIGVFLVGLGIAEISALAGLSLALGAFLAGLVISESEYGYQALGQIVPFRDVFMSFFFVSVGMLLDPRYLLDHAWLVLALALSVVVVKVLAAGVAVLVQRYPLRTAVRTGFSLAQIGEFSFVLAQAAVVSGVLLPGNSQTLLAVSVLTMMATPLLMALGPKAAEAACRLPLPATVKSGTRETPVHVEVTDHLLIVGYGLNGRNLARAARRTDIPYVVLEMNPHTVQRERELGEPIIFGDASNASVLAHAGARGARVAAVVINDPVATRRIVRLLRELNPTLHIIVRTRYLSEVASLRELGADDVIPEEFETSLQIFARALRQYLVPERDIGRLAQQIRESDYSALRQEVLATPSPLRSELDLVTLTVAEGAALAGRSLEEAALRPVHHVSALAILRGDDLLSNPSGQERLQVDDRVVLLGRTEDVTAVESLFAGEQEQVLIEETR